MTQAVADKSVAAVLGPELGTESAPMATIAESAKLPTVFTQSGSDGVVIGPYTFRVTAPQTTYFPVAQKYLQSKGVKTIATIYDSTNPTTTALAKDSLNANASTYGYSVTDSVAVTSTTQDFSAPITSILKSKPQVVGLFVIGAANATAVTQLRQAGFTGTILAQIGAGSGELTPAGSAGKNVVWATDYSAANTTPEATKFGAAFKAKFGTVASDFNAEGYDAGWLIVRAIKAAGAADRVSIQKGMNIVAQQGFDGAEGQLTFDNRDLRVPGVMVGWDGTKEILAP
jgi:branched-chain amino acid transport system substrate-binding protein